MNGRPQSFWIDSVALEPHARLAGDRDFDVAVLGGGLCGITTALMLKSAGVRVAVLEANTIGGGATGNTTGKVTSLHGLAYRDIAPAFGEDGARTYGAANEFAIDEMERLVLRHDIDCDFRRKPNFTFVSSDGDVDAVREEAELAARLGLPASFTTDVDLPVDVAGAVRFDDQAEFHPLRYLHGLARLIPGDGSEVFEDTAAIDVDEGAPLVVHTSRGKVTASHVVVATHFPFLDRGGFFARMHPERSYVVACRVRGSLPRSMYISADSPSRSIRTTPWKGEELLLVGGEGHRVGQEPDTEARYDALASWAREHFDVATIGWMWSAQDPIPADMVPFIGRLRAGEENLYVATGFAKWGLAHATVAARIVSDAILGHPNPWASLYDSTRGEPATSFGDLLKKNVNVAKRFVSDRLSHPDSGGDADEIPAGEAAIVTIDGDELAAFRDQDGALHLLSPSCTHMGCQVTWNSAERSWDCPCHGSRFDAVDGAVLEGPAVVPLRVSAARVTRAGG